MLTLHPAPPYHFARLLDILSRYAHPATEVAREGAYWRVLRLGAGLALVRVTALGTPEAPALAVQLMAQRGSAAADGLPAAVERVLPLDGGRAAFYRFARGDDRLWRVVEPLLGLPETRTPTLFEALAQAVIEQQIAWTAAQRAQRWLAEWAGARVSYDGHDYYAFPEPALIAAAQPDDLRPLKITFKRIGLLIDLARAVTAGTLDLEGLRSVPAEAAYKTLLGIKGVGHWTAVVALSRAFGLHGVAVNDVALQAAVNRYFYGGEGRLPAAQVAATFAPYGEYAGLAARCTLLRWVLDQYPPVVMRP